ncbi:hypothetical protein OPT61_g9521 [Boeremia exigua]|uniref:Uncharacterized protein n=1 Tax=Boeremia exigua TaxID=749465 RepID=A0ACC2HU24_9PLEO|nr:hypothetical protein OPT61_g9521 [Boeremia exigua]
MTRPEPSILCAQCKAHLVLRDKELQNELREYANDQPYQKRIDLGYHIDDTTPHLPKLTQSSKDGCEFCTVLLNRIKPEVSLYSGTLNLDFSYSFACRARSMAPVGGHLLICDVEVDHEDGCELFSVKFSVSSPDENICELLGLGKPQEPHPLSPANASRFLEEIEKALVCCSRPVSDRFVPMRLLDLGTTQDCPPMIIVPDQSRKPDYDYAALSYCWGEKKEADTNLRFTKESGFEKGIPWDRITAVVKDTIAVCKALLIRYLWVDALCIQKGNKNEWNAQAADVGRIYEHSRVTICALASSGCNQPFLLTRRFTTLSFQSELDININGHLQLLEIGKAAVEDNESFTHGQIWLDFQLSIWDTRAWCFQEHEAASRQLLFGRNRVHFNCKHGVYSENLPASTTGSFHPFSQVIQEYKDAIAEPDPEPASQHETEKWAHMMLYLEWYGKMQTEYNCRALTYREDKLAAIAGLASAMAEVVKDKYIAGIWEKELLRGLLWSTASSRETWTQHLAFLQAPDKSHLPSWSWLKCKGSSACGTTRAPILEGEMVPECVVLDVQLDLTTPSEFGQINSAALSIEGQVVPLSFGQITKDQRWESKRKPWDLWVGRERLYSVDVDWARRKYLPGGEGYETVNQDSDVPDVPDGLFLLRLAMLTVDENEGADSDSSENSSLENKPQDGRHRELLETEESSTIEVISYGLLLYPTKSPNEYYRVGAPDYKPKKLPATGILQFDPTDMADPLSILGGVAAGVQLVSTAAQALLATIQLMKDLEEVPERLALLMCEVEASISRLCQSCNAGSKIIRKLDIPQQNRLSKSAAALYTAMAEIHSVLTPLMYKSKRNGTPSVRGLWQSFVSLKVERELTEKLKRLNRLNIEMIKELGLVGLEIQLGTNELIVANSSVSDEAFSDIKAKLDSLHEEFRKFTLSIQQTHVITLEEPCTKICAPDVDGLPVPQEVDNKSRRSSDSSDDRRTSISGSTLCSLDEDEEERISQQRAEQMRRYLAAKPGVGTTSALKVINHAPNANLDFVLFNIKSFYSSGNFDSSATTLKTAFWTETDMAIYLMKVSTGAVRGSSESEARGLRLLKNLTSDTAKAEWDQNQATIIIELLSTLSPVNTSTCSYIRDALLQHLYTLARSQLPRNHPISLVLRALKKDKGDKHITFRALTFIADRLRSTLGPTHPLTQLATDRLCVLLRRSGDYTESLRIARTSIRALRSAAGPGSLQERKLLRRVEHVYIEQRDYPAALSVCFEIVGHTSFDALEPDPSFHDECAVYTMEDIAKICEDAGNLETAVAWLKQARISGGMAWGNSDAVRHIQDKLVEVLKELGRDHELEVWGNELGGEGESDSEDEDRGQDEEKGSREGVAA